MVQLRGFGQTVQEGVCSFLCQDGPMPKHVLAGKLPPHEMLIDPAELVTKYFTESPDPQEPAQRVSFGTSGHRGSAMRHSFNEAHLLAITQAVCELRGSEGATGPLFLGMDSHALATPAQRTVLEVLVANGVEVLMASERTLTATPLASRAVLRHNAGRTEGLADALLLTPSHNPPEDGGIKYNPPSGGPADTKITKRIEERANALIAGKNQEVKRVLYERACHASNVHSFDFVTPYIDELPGAIDMDVIRKAGVRIGVNPLGGASLEVWDRLTRRFGLNLTVVEPRRDPTFSFVPLDHDGKIRMDCSSPWAMSALVELRFSYDVAFGNDADADRHGIVTPSGGLMNPNHYLAVAVDYLFRNRAGWPSGAAVGKTLVSSALLDRVAAKLSRPLLEVPVGFKWFVDGLLNRTLGLGGEESAGASFLQRDGSPWTTDKDGLLLGLLAAEITATTGKDPSEHYEQLVAALGRPHYTRVDAPASPQQRASVKQISPASITTKTLAGEPLLACLTKAPGNGAEIGGAKLITPNGWIAIRPSGTEDILKIYAESFLGEAHLAQLVEEAQAIVALVTTSS